MGQDDFTWVDFFHPSCTFVDTMIHVENLSKTYRAAHRREGLGQALRALYHRTYRLHEAVRDLSFEIAAGERVGFLGPNGAGKTTTLKILAGLLYPTSGQVSVAGHTPAKREPPFLATITLVMGQKQQLLWDLPPLDTFAMNRALYDIPRAQYEETLAELQEWLGIEALVTKPTRQLSLGERMKCELVAALLHRPSVLFLDEPTIGLDVAMQATMRSFIRNYNERFGATVLLTSHYMDDVVALCPRVVVIDKGQLTYDGDLDELVRKVRPHKQVTLKLAKPVPLEELAALGTVALAEESRAILQIPQASLPQAVSRALARLPTIDLTIEDPPLEEVMRELFHSGGVR